MKHKTNTRALSWLLSLALMLSLLPGMSLPAYAEASSGTIGNAEYTISEDGVLTVGGGEFTIQNWASVFGTGGQSNSTPNATAKSIQSVVFQEGAVLTSTNMTKMFIYWESLESADLTNLTASAITDMGYLFFGCAKLTSVTFGAGVETSKVQYMYQMFQGCSSLRELDLSTFKAYTGTGKRSLYQTFYNCSNLVTIRVSDDWYIPSADGIDGVEGDYRTFYNCYKLIGGNGTKCCGNGDYSMAVIDGKDGKQGYFTSASAGVVHRHDFTYSASGSTLTATCSAGDCTLTDNKVELTLTPPAKTVYGDSNSAAATLEGREAFNAATGLNIGSSQYYVYYKKGSDIQLGAAPTTPGEYTVKVTISNVAGSSYTLTADYTIAQKEIGLTWADTTFHYDGNPHVPTATATGLVGSDKCDVTVTGEQTAIGNYTATASGLSNDRYKLPENTTTEFAIEGWVGTARYTIEEAPSPKKLFAAKSISHEITNGVLTIYGGVFNNADWKTAFANDDFITNTRDNITSVRFVKANDEDTAAKLTDSAQGMFRNWSKLESIDFTNLDTSDVTWMSAMFFECSSLTELDLSPLDTRNVTNMSNMFYKCSKLEKITVGENWKTASSTSHMFSGCNELAGNVGTTYKALFGNYINTDDNPDNPALPDVNGEYAHVDKGTIDPGFFYNAHEHHLTYTVDQSKPWTITATCSDSDCYLGDSNNHSVSISLVKPTLYVYYMDVLNKQGDEYDKGASPLATLTMQSVGNQALQDSTTVADPDGKINGISISVSTFTDANTAAPTFEELTGATIGDIEYYEKGSATKLDKAPSDAGTYTAKITIGTATASVDYRIAKRFHSPVLTSPTKNPDFAFGETEQELIVPGTIKQVDDTDTSTFEYALGTDATTIPTDGWSTDIPKGKGEGSFYVFYRVAGDKNHGSAMESEFPNKSGYANTSNPEHESNSYKPAYSVIVISSTAPTPPTPNELNYNGENQALVTKGSTTVGKMQYALGEIKSEQPSADQGDTTPIVIDGENKYMWKAGDWSDTVPQKTEPGVYYVLYRVVSTESPEVTIAEPAYVAVTLGKGAPTAVAPTATATYGQTLNDVPLSNPEGNTNGEWAWAVPKATSVGDVGTNAFKAKFTPTDTTHYKAVEVDVTVTVNKAGLTGVSVTQNGTLTYTGEAQTPEVTAAATAVNDQSVTFTYSKTQDGEYGDMPTVTNVADGGTFYYKASAPNHNDKTGSFTITVNKATPGEVTAPTPDAVTYDPTQKLADVTLSNGWTWADSTIVPTVSNSGYQAALTVDDANYDYSSVEGYSADTHTVTRTVALTVNKASSIPATVTANNRNHDNTEQPLVTVTGTATGGEMQYATGTDATTAPTEGWNTTIPEGTEVGTYYVWYKVAGDGNHNDTEPACVTVSIRLYAALTDKPTISVTRDGNAVTEGAPRVDDVLTANTTATDLTYQWYRGDELIEGATDATYTAVAADVGKTIKVTVTQTKKEDGTDYADNEKPTQTSAATAAVVKKVRSDLRITNEPLSYAYGSGEVLTITASADNFASQTPVIYYSTGRFTAGMIAPTLNSTIHPWSEVTSNTTLNAGEYYVAAYYPETAGYEAFLTPFVMLKVAQGTRPAPSAVVSVEGDKMTATLATADKGKALEYTVTDGTAAPADNAAWTLVTADANGVFPLGALSAASHTIYLRQQADVNYAVTEASAGFAFTLEKISVSYNANGGVGAPATQVSTSAITVSSVKPTRSGYTFNGWCEDANGATAAKTSYTTSVTLYAKWTPNTYTVKFNANGGDGTMGDQSFTYDDAAAALTSNGFTAPSGKSFVGWATSANGAVLYSNKQSVKNLTAEANGVVNLYAVWAENVYNVSITVKSENKSAPVDLKLMRGNTELAQKSSISMTSGTSEAQTFEGIPAGTYNVVATQGTKTMTVAVILTNANHSAEITMPTTDTNSTLTVAEDARPVVVDGLAAEAESKAQDGSTVTVAMSVTKQEEQELSATATEEARETQAAIESIKETIGEPSSNQTREVEYMNIDLTKKVGGENPTPLTETTNVITVLIPYDMTGKNASALELFRYHNGTASALTKHSGNGKPGMTYADGNFYVDLLNSFIYLYSNQFSTYAISYTETTSSNPGNNTSSHSSGGSGGVYGALTYAPTVSNPSNGTVSINPTSPKYGDKVTITAKPDEGYAVDSVTVTNQSGDKVRVTKVNETTYTFLQPAGKVKIDVSFKEAAPVTTGPVTAPQPDVFDAFTDLDKAAWYRDGVKYVLENGIMNGMGDGIFAPNGTASRAMIAQILWNMEGKPAVDYAMSYGDVSDSAWYSEAIRWATAEGIMGGYSDNAFGPEDSVTREQLAAILYRYARRKGIDVSIGEETNLLSYDDASDVSDWAVSAMQWTTGSGLITGRTASTLNPRDTATRAEIATIIMRYCTEVSN